MTGIESFGLFLLAASAVALSPGPGVFYVAARTLAGGAAEGAASVAGTAAGGLLHVLAGAIGLSALLMASAAAFTVLKLAGAGYLLWLGLTMLLRADPPTAPLRLIRLGAARAFRDGATVELFNPKTAVFFLAFIPHFVDPAAGPVALQFLMLGSISVLLNSAVDLAVAWSAGALRRRWAGRERVQKRLQQAAGGVLCALGLSLAMAQRSS